MIIYVAIFFTLVLLRQNLAGRPNARVQAYYLALILLFFFSAFRFDVGCDWTGYENHWWLQSEFGVLLAYNKEPLWWLLIQILQWFDFSYPWLNVFTSLIFFIGIHVFAGRQKDPLGFLIILFPILIINLPMSGIRQAAAIGIMCIAFCAFQDKKTFWAFIWVTLASMFHLSAIIFFFMLPLVHGNNLKRRIIAASLFLIPIIYLFLSVTSLGVSLSDRFVGSGKFSQDAQGAVFRVCLLTATALFYFFVMRKKWKEISPKSSRLATLSSFLMILTLPLVLVSSVSGDRFAYFLIPLQAMILSNIPFLPIRQYRPIFSVAPYLILGFTFLIWVSFSWHFTECYVPYKTWIFGFPLERRPW